MNVEERDTRLGDVLDRAVQGIDVEGVPATVLRRGSRRRAGVLVASVTAVAVFLAGVGLAATQVGRDAEDPADLGTAGTFASPDFRWTMPIPAGWRSGGAHSVGGPQAMLPDLRTSFVTTSLPASFTGSVMVGSLLPSGTVGTDVIVIVDPFVGTRGAEPTTLVLNAEREDTENAGWTWRDGKICGETGCARVYVWHGPDTSEADLATALSVGEGVRMIETRPDASVLTPTIDYRDGQDGFSMTYPAGWTVAEHRLSPIVDPAEILSVGTFPLLPGGTAMDMAVPGQAIDDVGPGDTFLTLREYRGAPRAMMRPNTFSPTSVCQGVAVCAEGSSFGLLDLRVWLWSFTDPSSGRTFQAFLTMGEKAYQDPARSDAAWAVLDSLRFEPKDLTIRFEEVSGWTSEALPAPTVTDVDGAWTSNEPFVSEGGPCCGTGLRFAAGLPDDGVVVLAWIVGPAEDGPNVNFPARELPLSLPDEVASEWEGYTPGTGRSQILATVQGWHVQIRIYYGTSAPSDDTRAAAQSALDRLIVVPR